MTIYDKLIKYQDLKYRDFQSLLVPNIPIENMIGVRTPDLRNIAKEMNNTKEGEEFLSSLPHKYYEENLIHSFLIAMIKDFDKCIYEVERFLRYIDCWPVCDQSSPKVFKKNHDKLLPYIKKWMKLKHIYSVRFALRMLMNEFLDDDFKEEYLELASSIRSEEYYLNMMVAWFFATALAKQYNSTIKYFEERRLSPWVHHKAIQKALESYRVSDEHKEYLSSLK